MSEITRVCLSAKAVQLDGERFDRWVEFAARRLQPTTNWCDVVGTADAEADTFECACDGVGCACAEQGRAIVAAAWARFFGDDFALDDELTDLADDVRHGGDVRLGTVAVLREFVRVVDDLARTVGQ